MSLPNISFPSYTTTLPSNGATVKYRPFLVKEKKLLMMAGEDGTFESMYETTKQIIANCTLSKLNVESLPLFDIQHLFLKIRAKSVGETSDFIVPCSQCKNQIEVSVNLDEVKIEKNPLHSTKIMLTDTVGLEMKYPTITSEKVWNTDIKQAEQETELIINCIECVFEGDQLYPAKDTDRKELVQLIENMTTENYDKIKKFFETMPKISHRIDYTCTKCGNKDHVVLNNLTDFFE